MKIRNLVKNTLIATSAIIGLSTFASTNTLQAPKSLNDMFSKERFGLFFIHQQDILEQPPH